MLLVFTYSGKNTHYIHTLTDKYKILPMPALPLTIFELGKIFSNLTTFQVKTYLLFLDTFLQGSDKNRFMIFHQMFDSKWEFVT